MMGLVSLLLGLASCAESNVTSAVETAEENQPDLQSDAGEDQNADNTTNGSDRLETTPTETEPDPVEEPPVEEVPPAVVFMPLNTAQDVVEFVEVDRYMGLWYEIATTPSFQQASCTGTTAEYVFNEAQGWVEVTNTCYIGGLEGTPQGIQGRAELVDLETQAKLNVIFFGQAAPYWVVALDGAESEEPYQWAVVSVPGGKTMWLLSRTPQISDDMREAIETHLLERGFPIETLIDTLQGE